MTDESDAALEETPSTPDASRSEPTAFPGAKPLSTPPTYRGSSGSSSACTQTFRTAGYEPDDGKSSKRPLFLYFVGTEIVAADESSKYDCRAGERVTAAMAQRGFYALSVEYDNKVTAFFTDKQACLFRQENREGLLASVCALPNVDCSLGIATWGHSQGALLAHAAANHDSRVKAVWTTGYSGLTGAKLPFDRFRVVNGEADTMNASFATIVKTAGLSTSECPDAQADQCLRSDGSGFIIVRKSQCQVTAADHCWFDKRSCSDNAETLEPRWADADSDAAFALEANADWVAQTALRK